MGKKNSGGKNFKKQKKVAGQKENELVFKEDQQSYARIIKILGDGRFDCECFESQRNLIGIIRGSMRKKVWLGLGDIVLISFRNFDDSKCDIIHKYNIDEAIRLKNYNELPSSINLQATALELADTNNLDDSIGFDFDEI